MVSQRAKTTAVVAEKDRGSALALAREALQKALVVSQQGKLDEASRLARSAAKAMPKEAGALQLMLEYVGQYEKLADQARLRLNGSNEVDLGQPHGKAQFVEQDAQRIMFFLRGRHLKFTIQEFNALAGVRFRVARDFLDRAPNRPANDLILGACHYLHQWNGDGNSSLEASLREAENRFKRAARSSDPLVREHGHLFMQLLEAGLRG